MMEIEPEIILPYEELPHSNNDLIKSFKIIQDIVKYYEEMIREPQISIKNLESKIDRVEKTPNNPKQSIYEPGKGFSSDEIKKKKFFKKN